VAWVLKRAEDLGERVPVKVEGSNPAVITYHPTGTKVLVPRPPKLSRRRGQWRGRPSPGRRRQAAAGRVKLARRQASNVASRTQGHASGGAGRVSSRRKRHRAVGRERRAGPMSEPTPCCTPSSSGDRRRRVTLGPRSRAARERCGTRLGLSRGRSRVRISAWSPCRRGRTTLGACKWASAASC
jgi:hypothetical protein